MTDTPHTVNAYGVDPNTIDAAHADRVARALGLPHAVRIGCGGFLHGISRGVLTITPEPFDLSNKRIVSVPWALIERLGEVVKTADMTDTPTTHPLSPRLRELSDAVTQGREAVAREFTMRVPAEPDRDADIVLSRAADRTGPPARGGRGEGRSHRCFAGGRGAAGLPRTLGRGVERSAALMARGFNRVLLARNARAGDVPRTACRNRRRPRGGPNQGDNTVSSQQHDVAAPLREAETQIAIAFARLSKIGPGGLARYGWVGSWGEYQKIGQLLCRTRALAERIERMQSRKPKNIGDNHD